MKRVTVLILAACISGCSDPHRFEVDVGEPAPDRVELTLHGETTAMDRSGRTFSARRDNGADGSGQITIFYRDGETIACPIGYVTAGEEEPHRFVVREGVCTQS